MSLIKIDPAKVSFAEAERVRTERDRLLTASDWTQIADAPVDQAAWAAYRQALRDIPQQAGFPRDVAWPQKPQHKTTQAAEDVLRSGQPK